MFAREFKKHGMTHLSHFMKSPRIGDYMDVNVQGHIHKGMPHKGYQGKTGVVFNVSPRSVGLLMKKHLTLLEFTRALDSNLRQSIFC